MGFYKQIILLSFLSLSLFANVGKIATFSGLVLLDRGVDNIPVKVGTVLEKEDMITTIGDSKVQMIFQDNTLITIGKNSAFKIEEYLYDTVQEKNSKTDFNFFQGAFKIITGKIGEINKEKFLLQTKTASIGIRGTTILGDQSFIAFTQGSGYVVAQNVVREVDTGYMVRTAPNQPPSLPEPITKTLKQKFMQTSGITKEEIESTQSKFYKVGEETQIKSEDQTKKSSDKKISDLIGNSITPVTTHIFRGNLLGSVETSTGKLDPIVLDESSNKVKLSFDFGKGTGSFTGTMNFKTQSGKIWSANITDGSATIKGFNTTNISGVGHNSSIKKGSLSQGNMGKESLKSISGEFYLDTGINKAYGVFTVIKEN